MKERDIRQYLENANRGFICEMTDKFRQALTDAYIMGLTDGARLDGNENLTDGDLPATSLNETEDIGAIVRLKPGAILKKKITISDLVGCRNMQRIWNRFQDYNIRTVGDLAALSESDVRAWSNFGSVCMRELKEVMLIWGVKFRKE